MKLRNVNFFVNNLNLAADFYQKLGFKIVATLDKTINLETEEENVFLSLREVSNEREIPGKQSCSFYVNNVDGTYERFKLLGAPLEKDLKDTEIGRMFAIRDKDGNSIEFIQGH